MASITRRALARIALASLFALTSALTSAQSFAQTSNANGAPVSLRIGYQKSSTLITLLKARGSLEKALAPLNVRVSWNEFTSGLPLTEALNVDAVDFSADVADTVPIFAQAGMRASCTSRRRRLRPARKRSSSRRIVRCTRSPT